MTESNFHQNLSLNKKQHFQLLGMGSALVDTEIQLSDSELQQLSTDSLPIEKGMMALVEREQQLQILQQLKANDDELHHASGGSAGNSIYAASLFGCNSGFVCKVADDVNGSRYTNDMQAASIAVSKQHYSTEDEATGQCLVMVTLDAERTMCTFLGASASITDVNIPSDWSADIGYIESYLATSDNGCHAVNTFCSQIRSQGGQIALSLSDPGIASYFKQQIATMVDNKVDILFCNREEGQSWTKATNEEALYQTLHQFADLVVLTDGGNGAYISDSETSNGKEVIHVAGHNVEVIDTNGAGDMFAGAFLAAKIQGLDNKSAGAFACESAAAVVGVFSPRLNANDYAQLQQKLSH